MLVSKNNGKRETKWCAMRLDGGKANHSLIQTIQTIYVRMKSFRTLFAALVAAFILTITAFAGDPSGTWKFKAEAPNGRNVESTLTLKWANNQLSGTIDNRAGKTEIKNARFAEDQVTFTVERKFRRQKFTINYAGKLEGDTIEGTIQTTGREKNPVSIPWSAQREK